MQITNNIQINCAVCGAPMPTEINIGREHDRNLWIFRVMPCTKCEPSSSQSTEPLCLCPLHFGDCELCEKGKCNSPEI